MQNILTNFEFWMKNLINVSSGVHEALLIDECRVSSPGRQMVLRMRHWAVCSSYRGVNQTLIIHNHSSLVRTSAIWIIFLSTADILITDHCVHQGQKCPEFLLTVCSFVSFCETVFFLSNARSLGNCDVGIGIQYLGARIIDQWQFLEESWAENKTAEIANSRNSFHPQHSMRCISIKNLI